MLPLIGIAVALVCILLYQQWQAKRKWFYSLQEAGIQCLPVNPFLGGNLFEMFALRGIEVHRTLLSKFGSVSGFYFGTLKSVLLADYDLIRQICIGRAGEFPNRSNWFRGLVAEPEGFLNLSLIGIGDLHWKKQRAAISKSFTDSKLDQLRPLMLDRVFTMLKVIPGNQKTESVIEKSTSNIFKRLTLDIIGTCAFGVETNCQVNEKDNLLQASEKLFNSHRTIKIYILGMMYDILKNPVRRLVTVKMWLEEKFLNNLDGSKYMMAVCKNIFQQRRKQASEEQARNDLLHSMLTLSDNNNNSISSSCPAMKMQELSANGQTKFTDAEIVSNMILFYEAGFETSSTALTFMSHLLNNYPLVQRRMRIEIIKILYEEGFLKPLPNADGVLIPSADEATDEHLLQSAFSYSVKDLKQKLNVRLLRKFHYMDCFITESMRVYPPVWNFISRTGTQDTVKLRLPGQETETEFDKHTRFTIPVIHIHHDPKYWTRPFEFRPHRFSNVLKESRDFSAAELEEMSREFDQYNLKNCPSLNFSQGQNIRPFEPEARSEQQNKEKDEVYHNDIDESSDEEEDVENQSTNSKTAFRKPDPVHYCPFGIGPRICIGMRFALLEIKLTLMLMLLQYELELTDKSERGKVDLEFKSVTIGAKNDIQSRFVLRTQIQQQP